ncbi:hypothetical protein JVT61DRAFT_12054 [Boletus reticuloceps]|uniref:Uncharacterized protein n=1 Tax=Boletus reticuloceps TaxID=495285 RepID=A0A8I2YEM8_9AGAM|nr:hypothetical protein JVT61DRAFT_12054 [Boletus reticuloceps]
MLKGKSNIGVAHYFIQVQSHRNALLITLTVISLYSNSNTTLLQESSGARSITLIPASLIDQIVSMNPHRVDDEDHYIMFKQPGDNVTNLGGFQVSCEDDEDVDGQVDDNDNADAHSNGHDSGDL